MKKIVFIFLLISPTIFAQNRELDSIKNEIDQIETKDSLLVDKRINYISKALGGAKVDDEILDYIHTTLEMSNELNYGKGQAVSYQHLGSYYQTFKTDAFKALEYFQKSISIIDKNPHLENYSSISLTNIALLYNERGEHKKALDIYRIIQKKFNRFVITELYLGLVHGSLNQNDSAIYYLEKAIIRSKKYNQHAMALNAQSNLSAILIKENRVDEAIQHIEEALKTEKTYFGGVLNSSVYINAAYAYLANADFEKAEFYINKAVDMPSTTDNLVLHKSLYGTLSDIYWNQGKYKEAMNAYEQYTKLNDSLMAAEQRVELAKKDMAFEAERKKIISDAEISKQKFISKVYLFSGIGILLLIGLVLIFLNQRRKIKTIAKENEFKKDVAESKLIALRTQLNPHFIFNAMNSIEQYMTTHGTEKASGYLIKFSALMRRILQSSEKNWITLQEEMELMRVYIEIESLRLKNPIQLQVVIGEQLDPENTLVPSLFIQPFIENSIKHGISKKEDHGIIKINIKQAEEQLICAVEDNGIGRHASLSKNKEYKSMGMKIAKERVDYINQLTSNRSSFEVQDLEEGLKVTITIPHKTQF